MQMFAQLIVNRTIIQQTTPVGSEDAQDHPSWKVKFDCGVFVFPLNWLFTGLIPISWDSPPQALTFRVAVMRKTQQGNRLLGFIEIGQDKALSFGEQRKRVSTLHARKPNLKITV